MNVVKIILLVILLFVLLILPHEFGHFITAKLFGVKVNEFSFGMGPLILKKKKGDTLYSLRAFPIGGFCAMEDGDGTDEVRASDGFYGKKAWQKIIILIAGSVMNILTALFTLLIVFIIVGNTSLKLDVVEPDSPAGLAGIEHGDRIVRIDDYELKSWDELSEVINAKNGEAITIEVKRNGELKSFNVTPIAKDILDENGEVTGTRYVVGFSCQVTHNPLKAVKESIVTGWNMYVETFKAIGMLFTGKVGIDEVSGPVGIVKVVADTNVYGMYYFALIVALLCLNLAIVNMLPFPALDGGRIIFVLVSAITGKAINPKVETAINTAGMVLLLSFTAFITVKDIFKLI